MTELKTMFRHVFESMAEGRRQAAERHIRAYLKERETASADRRS